MKVVLTRTQLNRLRCIADDHTAIWLSSPVDVSTSRVVVEMPAIGWARLAEDAAGHVFGVREGWRHDTPKSLILAYTIVQRAVNARERHPALYHKGMAGRQPEMLPVWDLGDRFSPYPADGPFVVLVPEFRRLNGVDATLWWPSTASYASPILQETTHLTFC